VPKKRDPDLSLFFDILHTLESINAPYMIIGAFAGTVYGVTRVTYDIDIVVELDDAHIESLVEAYPPPRYYADPVQMRDAIKHGIMFNIIDTSRGEKADLVPLTMASRYRPAFEHRVRQRIETPSSEPFSVWCALAQDVIVGKLMAWAEGHSHKHQADIYEILVFQYLSLDPDLSAAFDETYVDRRAATLGDDVVTFWRALKAAAHRAVDEERPGNTHPPDQTSSDK
jgi:hypothetical protein